jgi:hypothetical protein
MSKKSTKAELQNEINGLLQDNKDYQDDNQKLVQDILKLKNQLAEKPKEVRVPVMQEIPVETKPGFETYFKLCLPFLGAGLILGILLHRSCS